MKKSLPASRRSLFLLVFVMLFQSICFAQIKAAKFKSFIPAEYMLLDSASGNLNKDAYPDLVLILQIKDSIIAEDSQRPLILLAGTDTGGYKLVSRNDNVVLCKGCGGIMGDPYQAIVVKNGYFSIEHYGGSGWRWTRIITFKYHTISEGFKLHKDAGQWFHAAEPDKIKLNVFNKNQYGRMKFTEYKSDND